MIPLISLQSPGTICVLPVMTSDMPIFRSSPGMSSWTGLLPLDFPTRMQVIRLSTTTESPADPKQLSLTNQFNDGFKLLPRLWGHGVQSTRHLQLLTIGA